MALVPRTNLLDFDRLFDDFWAPARTQSREVSQFFAPRVDVREHDRHYEISVELPGVKKEDISITLQEGLLTIQAEARQESKEEKEGKIIRQERHYGKFSRSFNVGDNVSEDDIKASFDNGVLTIEAPKAPEVAPQQKRIEVS